MKLGRKYSVLRYLISVAGNLKEKKKLKLIEINKVNYR